MSWFSCGYVCSTFVPVCDAKRYVSICTIYTAQKHSQYQTLLALCVLLGKCALCAVSCVGTHVHRCTCSASKTCYISQRHMITCIMGYAVVVLIRAENLYVCVLGAGGVCACVGMCLALTGLCRLCKCWTCA